MYSLLTSAIELGLLPLAVTYRWSFRGNWALSCTLQTEQFHILQNSFLLPGGGQVNLEACKDSLHRHDLIFFFFTLLEDLFCVSDGKGLSLFCNPKVSSGILDADALTSVLLCVLEILPYALVAIYDYFASEYSAVVLLGVSLACCLLKPAL